jgi:hypothetical protein
LAAVLFDTTDGIVGNEALALRELVARLPNGVDIVLNVSLGPPAMTVRDYFGRDLQTRIPQRPAFL